MLGWNLGTRILGNDHSRISVPEGLTPKKDGIPSISHHQMLVFQMEPQPPVRSHSDSHTFKSSRLEGITPKKIYSVRANIAKKDTVRNFRCRPFVESDQ